MTVQQELRRKSSSLTSQTLKKNPNTRYVYQLWTTSLFLYKMATTTLYEHLQLTSQNEQATGFGVLILILMKTSTTDPTRKNYKSKKRKNFGNAGFVGVELSLLFLNNALETFWYRVTLTLDSKNKIRKKHQIKS